MSLYADIILPLPLPKPFTYAIPDVYTSSVVQGQRVVVPFGKMKFYTGIVYRIHEHPPLGYDTKAIASILEPTPIITQKQFHLWEWMVSYYLTPLGAIMKAALPSFFLLESETILVKNEDSDIDWSLLSDDEHLILEALEKGPLTFNDIIDITGKKTVMRCIGGLLAEQYVELQQLLKDKYKPKRQKQLRLCPKYLQGDGLAAIFDGLQKAPKQQELLMGYLSDHPKGGWTESLSFQKKWGTTAAVVTSLVKKEIFERREITIDRLQAEEIKEESLTLTPAQTKAYKTIESGFAATPVVLLEGITGSGKTAVYIKHIKAALEQGKQVLYLLPEISLTTQVMARLKATFPGQIAVFHSKFSPQERTEIWRHVLNEDTKAQLVIGARSAVLLPFQNLGLVIVDEEHESSFKQFDPAPRYHARDTAIVMAQQAKANVLLGSATPSLESLYQVKAHKYGYVTLKERFGGAQLPTISLVDLKEAHRKKQMHDMFSQTLLEAMETTLAKGQQIILFHNRRGYSPVLECQSCGHIPQCIQCDVSLTYHQFNPRMQCHYCGYHIPRPDSCMACGTPHMTDKGTGTQQIETALHNLFPNIQVARMDWDSTRGKNDFEKLLTAFSNGDYQILVGTQMVVKGLDFKNVQLVGVVNADQLLNYPDFRAFERSAQMLSQVAGRAGRSKTPGQVLIQTYNPSQTVLRQVQNYQLEQFYQSEFRERERLGYPPYGRLIRITFKHRNRELVENASVWFANVLRQSYAGSILGPTAPLVARIQNQYLQQLLLKMASPADRKKLKILVLKTQKSFEAIGAYRAVRLIIDVDPY